VTRDRRERRPRRVPEVTRHDGVTALTAANDVGRNRRSCACLNRRAEEQARPNQPGQTTKDVGDRMHPSHDSSDAT
jgi:hypothetical protein